MAKIREEIRKILGEAHTEDIENRLVALHLSVVDPLKDDVAKYKAEADKLPGIQKQLDDMKGGEDWKTKFETEHAAFEKYKTDIASKEALTNTKSAFRKLLDGLKIDPTDADLIMAGTDFTGIKLGKDGALEKADDLTSSIKTRYARYIPEIKEKGAPVGNPPKDNPNNGANPRAAEIAKRFHERRYGTAPADDGANKTE